tara:strand:- start:8493 stop:9128 length:636 start_codon:yes stop_codon:yes gene_type:complete
MNVWKAENVFYQYSNVNRISKLLFHYELYKKIIKLEGNIVECGVFKGSSLIRFLTYVDLFEKKRRHVYGFDVFGKFPSTNRKEDKKFANKHNQNLGNGIDINKLSTLLSKKNLKNFKLIKGNILNTIEPFLKKKKKFKVSLLHLDLDLYVPTKFCLEKFYPYIVKNGVIILDDYKHVSGATRAVNKFIKKKKLKLQKLSFHKNQNFIIKTS